MIKELVCVIVLYLQKANIMKNLLKVLLLFVLLSCSFCSNDKDVYYSCNTKLDAQVKRDLEDIRSLSREEWSQITDLEYKHAVYKAFTPQIMVVAL